MLRVGACMAFFSKKVKPDKVNHSKNVESGNLHKNTSDIPPTVLPELDISVLRQNNISLLTLDERWNRLFTTFPISPELEKSQKAMNELIKKEAMLKQELEQLEPNKKKAMQQIIFLTKEAFENNNKEAKNSLLSCKTEIERLNARYNVLLEEIEKSDDALKTSNFELLRDTMLYVFTTLQQNKRRADDIKQEIAGMETRIIALSSELETIALDWTDIYNYFTDLIGTSHVKRLEEAFFGEHE